MGKKESSMQRRRRRTYFIIFLLLLLLIAGSIIGLLLVPAGSVMHDLFGNILGAAVGAALIDVIMDVVSKKDKEEDIQIAINEALVPSDRSGVHPKIYELYQQQQIEGLLKNCLASYCVNDYLSDGYLSYIKGSYLSMRRKEVYKVKVSADADKNGNPITYLTQNYKHTAVFRRSSDVRLKMFFTFATKKATGSDLDAIMGDSTYTFREELADESQVELVIGRAVSLAEHPDDAGMKEKLASSLGLKVSLFKDEDTKDFTRIPYESMSFKLLPTEDGDDYCGLDIAFDIPPAFIVQDGSYEEKGRKHKDTRYYAEENFVSFTSRIELKYRVRNDQNTFYFVFSRPAVRPRFTLTFDNGVAVEDVKYMTFLSFDTPEAPSDDGEVTVKGNSFDFATERMIFPRSGVAFSWINPAKDGR